MRTHTCGELTEKNLGKEVVLAGWCHTRRDHGGVIFVDLRDRYGLTQIVFEPKNKEIFKMAEHLRREDVLSVKGKVRARPKGLENPKLKTGKIEVLVTNLEIISKSETPPFEIENRAVLNEDIRLKYRYLDLRRPIMQQNLIFRHNLVQAVREFLNKQGFLEIETPMLIRNTPEGARDYVVPSRIQPGKFYSLPQSPQLYKQLLMISGLDKYYQIARCLRDEDLRADRQPEFTQIDMEMSFIDEEDIIQLNEKLLQHLFKTVMKQNLKIPFPRISYAGAMEKYGTDKPDTRFALELINVTDIVKKSDFLVFNKAEQVKCICLEKELSRNEIDSWINWATKNGAKGLAWIKVTDKGLESSIVKYFDKKVQSELLKKTKSKKGILFFIADEPKIVNEILSKLRTEMAKKYKLIKDGFNFIWVTDFPMFEYSEEEKRLVALHHPFTMPKQEDLKILDSYPEKAKAKAYDIVLNGIELGGGSIRIHKPDIQEKVLKSLGIDKKEAEKKFGFLLEALRYGAPPHGGIAYGLDRFIAILTGNESIREVIAFPKNKAAQSLVDDAPSEVDEKQLKELGLKLDLPKK